MGETQTSKIWWRDFNIETVMAMHNAGRKAAYPRSPEMDSMGMNGHRQFMNDCIKGSRGVGNSAYCRAVKPFWDARDIAFYFWGVSDTAAAQAGYEAMQAKYNAAAPAWAWW